MPRPVRPRSQRAAGSSRRSAAKGTATLTIRLSRLSHGEGLPLPAYQTDGAAGMDLLAAVEAGAPLLLMPGARTLVPTGLALEVPLGHEAQVRPRSGLAVRYGVTLLNSPGTIDSDYRGEIQVLLINHGTASFAIHRGERIAQLVVAPVTHAHLVESDALSVTRRGAGGFGSTGTGSQVRLARRKTIPKKRRK